MRAQRLWLGLGVAAAMLVAVASAAGVFSSDYVYARETASWAAQGIGQDWANLLLVVPVLLLTTWRAARGSARALALWRGLLLYVIYSYVLYSFFIHFNRLFLVYVGALALAFFAFVGSCVAERQQQPASRGSVSLASTVLVVCAVLFAFMWLSEIVPATLRDMPPPSLTDVGLVVNPVHVLDLAFVLPAMIVTAVLLRKRHPLGSLLAVPILTFAVAMGVAIEFMFYFTSRRGLPTSMAPALIMGGVILAAALAAYSMLPAARHAW